MKSALIFAPWWQHEAHVGNLRLRRHVAWLREAGYRVTVVDSGLQYNLSEVDGLTKITIPDPLRMHVAPSSDAPAPRKPNALRRWLAYAMLIPDPSIVWARRAMAHPVVRHAVRTSSLLMASSPPEAAFIACAKLSRRYGIPFWMDMRDGWLDEPLKPLLRSSAIQRWRERRLEAFCLNMAAVVTVTSDQWAEMLKKRYPQFSDKLHVVTNAAPASAGRTLPPSDSISLCYAGRLKSSRPERDTNDLATVLAQLPRHSFSIIGDLTPDERQDASSRGWDIRPALRRTTLVHELSKESGLVLLSSSQGSIPAKFFDYLSAGRPLLGIAPRDSAAWVAMSHVPQAYAVDPAAPDVAVIAAFVNAASQSEPTSIPEMFTESAVRARFMEALSCL
jgi:hypothetical protein